LDAADASDAVDDQVQRPLLDGRQCIHGEMDAL